MKTLIKIEKLKKYTYYIHTNTICVQYFEEKKFLILKTAQKIRFTRKYK